MTLKGSSPGLTETLSHPAVETVWHAACVHSLLDSIQGLGSLLDSTEGNALLEEEINALSSQAAHHWAVISEQDGFTGSHDDKLAKASHLPDSISLNETDHVITLVWSTTSTTRDGLQPWDETELPSSAFDVIDLTSFPEQTSFVSLPEGLHVTTAFTVGALRSVASEFQELRQQPPSRVEDLFEGWLTSAKRSARLAEQALDDEDFKGWDRAVSDPASMVGIPQALNTCAATTKALQTLATSMTIACLNTAFIGARQRAPEQGDAYRVCLDQLYAMLDRFDHVLDGYNQALIFLHGVSPEALTTQVILRPSPPGTPKLAMIPK